MCEPRPTLKYSNPQLSPLSLSSPLKPYVSSKYFAYLMKASQPGEGFCQFSRESKIHKYSAEPRHVAAGLAANWGLTLDDFAFRAA